MAHRAHVEDGRDARGQALGEPETRGHVHRLRVQGGFPGPDVLPEPREELQVLRSVPQKGLAEMEMRLHESGKNQFPASRKAFDGLSGPFGKPPRFRPRGADRSILGIEIRFAPNIPAISQSEQGRALSDFLVAEAGATQKLLVRLLRDIHHDVLQVRVEFLRQRLHDARHDPAELSHRHSLHGDPL